MKKSKAAKKETETRSVTISFQIRPSLKAALESAATADQRSLSQLIAMELEAAMRAKGFLK
jgi:predicted HicB family RNase H-like nuclease